MNLPTCASYLIALVTVLMSWTTEAFAQHDWTTFSIWGESENCEPSGGFYSLVLQGTLVFIGPDGLRTVQPIGTPTQFNSVGTVSVELGGSVESKQWVSVHIAKIQGTNTIHMHGFTLTPEELREQVGYSTDEEGLTKAAAHFLANMDDAIAQLDREPYVSYRCSDEGDLPGHRTFVHQEAIAVLRRLAVAVNACEFDGLTCANEVFLVADVTGNQKLSTAEVARVFRVMAYFAYVTTRSQQEQRPVDISDEEIIAATGIGTLLAPLVATAIVEGSDYNADGELSADEAFLDRDMAHTAQAFEKVTFDSTIAMLQSALQGVTALRGILN